MVSRGRLVTSMAIGLALAAALAGCGGSASQAPDDGSIAVTLKEWGIVARPDGTSPGEVVFRITNEGPQYPHDFVVIRTQLDPTTLPVTLTGQVDITAPGITVVDKTEKIAVGETREFTVTLTEGPYVLVCNDYTADPQMAHYTAGMRVPFPVE